jgi:hypothetical protein
MSIIVNFTLYSRVSEPIHSDAALILTPIFWLTVPYMEEKFKNYTVHFDVDIAPTMKMLWFLAAPLTPQH